MHRCQRREVHNLGEKCSQLNDYIRGIHRRRKQRHTGVTNNGTFTMTGGTISGNSARQNLGKALYLQSGCRCFLWQLIKRLIERVEKYMKDTAPEMEVIAFDNEDVIVTSYWGEEDPIE
jgi:hypothetical protein